MAADRAGHGQLYSGSRPHRREGTVRQFQTDAPLHITRLLVTYDNGEPDRLEVREQIEKGGDSRAIDLRGVGQRSLRKIEFWYTRRACVGGRADLTVFGMK